jgi:hypothetical protein
MPDESAPVRTPVFCDLTDCVYYEFAADKRVYCHHKDKPFHIQVRPCPLYRLDWKKRMKGPKAG